MVQGGCRRVYAGSSVGGRRRRDPGIELEPAAATPDRGQLNGALDGFERVADCRGPKALGLEGHWAAAMNWGAASRVGLLRLEQQVELRKAGKGYQQTHDSISGD